MQIDEKKPNILIPNIPENKMKELENIIKPILKGMDIKTEIMTAPYSMTHVLKQYEVLHADMQDLTEAIKTMKEGFNEKLNKIRSGVYKQIPKSEPGGHGDLLLIHNIKTKLKIKGDKTSKALAMIALSKKPLTTKELAKEIYGKTDGMKRGYVSELLIPFYGTLITAERGKDRVMKYSWKDQRALKKIME